MGIAGARHAADRFEPAMARTVTSGGGLELALVLMFVGILLALLMVATAVAWLSPPGCLEPRLGCLADTAPSHRRMGAVNAADVFAIAQHAPVLALEHRRGAGRVEAGAG